LKIRKINTRNKKDVKKFIQFPFDLYKDSPCWVPQLRGDTGKVLDKDKHPFYQHSEADFFLAEDNNRILGRIAAIANSRSNSANNLDTVFFYYYESIDDSEVSGALFNEVENWTKERGHTQVYGPKGLLQGDGIGLLVDGFDYIPAVGIPYNFDYYDHLVKQAGFEKKFDYFSAYVDTKSGLSDKVRRVAEKVKKRSGFWVRKFETKEEIVVIAKRMLSVADPRLIKLVYKGDKIIGFLFSYPNICRGLQKTNGRLFPFGWFHIMREFKTTKYMDSNGIGILPEYQGLGPTAVIYTEFEKTFREFDFEFVETVQTREDNIASLGESSHFVMDWVKTHRVYQMDL